MKRLRFFSILILFVSLFEVTGDLLAPHEEYQTSAPCVSGHHEDGNADSSSQAPSTKDCNDCHLGHCAHVIRSVSSFSSATLEASQFSVRSISPLGFLSFNQPFKPPRLS